MLLESPLGRKYLPADETMAHRTLQDLHEDESLSFIYRKQLGLFPRLPEMDEYLDNEAQQDFEPHQIDAFRLNEIYLKLIEAENDNLECDCDKYDFSKIRNHFNAEFFYTPKDALSAFVNSDLISYDVFTHSYFHVCPTHPKKSGINAKKANYVFLYSQNYNGTYDHTTPVTLNEIYANYFLHNLSGDMSILTLEEALNAHFVKMHYPNSREIWAGASKIITPSFHSKPLEYRQHIRRVRAMVPEGMAYVWLVLAAWNGRRTLSKERFDAIKELAEISDPVTVWKFLAEARTKNIVDAAKFIRAGADYKLARVMGGIPEDSQTIRNIVDNEIDSDLIESMLA